MSKQIGLDTINLKSTPRLGHTEYSADFPSLVEAVTGPLIGDPEKDRKRFYDAWDYDLYFAINDGPEPWEKRGRTSDMGHAEYAEGGVDKRETNYCPFSNVEEVLEFDAVKEYGLPDFDELVTFYENFYQDFQSRFDQQVFTGGYYKTIISGAIQTFGWDMLLMGASDSERFSKVLTSFGELTLHHIKAWAETSIEVFIQHDDIVWTEGPFMNPAIYREVIFPMYKKFWTELHNKGKKVLFCSDGNYEMFMDDIADAGAEGFIFEPCNSFENISKKYGQSHCLVGSCVDCRTLTFSDKDSIQKEIDTTLKHAKNCKGLFFAVGNHIPSNVPVENAMHYMEYLKANWAR